MLGYVEPLLPSSGVESTSCDALDDQGAITPEPLRRELRRALTAIVAEIEERR